MDNTWFNSPLLGLVLTFFTYKIGERLVEKLNLNFLPPLLTSCALIIFLITFTGLFTYEQYALGGTMINFLLGPATIALALPLVRNFSVLVKHYKILFIGVLTGTLSGVISIIFFARLFGASEQVMFSLVPKSVTTPIAMEIASTLGGIPPLTAACVICTGIFGAMCGHKILAAIGVKNDISIGLALGASSHALGVSSCIPISALQVAIGSLAIALVGIATAIFAPPLVNLL
ncbi:MAG TPA: LrgB family protein [Candidatus Avacidaminococcus intestinavium]|uniref:LrgB family protein n=1 Tax=Candidatus Avacidaminococcus intestinavium TaxID=2840684 RepID=A0A9D1MPX1_9FIRM|nr:LrgB family protein [Candidatus Avacidaminococcus intestinavium]